jgi:hypothetical protein
VSAIFVSAHAILFSAPAISALKSAYALAEIGYGSIVTYAWYRFADQPAMLNADLTPAEREEAQRRVELIHRAWTKERTCIAAPTTGKLASLDPGLIVTPPAGLEAGYVPIALRQERRPNK